MELVISTILIDRGVTLQVPVTAPEYEIAVLEQIHGEEFIIRVSEATQDAEELTADEAFNTLRSKYSKDAVDPVFKNLKAFAKASGLPLAAGDATPEKDVQSSQIVHTAEPKAKKAVK